MTKTKLKTKRIPKLYTCIECGKKKSAMEFPVHWTYLRWSRSTCWDCLEEDEDGYAIRIC